MPGSFKTARQLLPALVLAAASALVVQAIGRVSTATAASPSFVTSAQVSRTTAPPSSSVQVTAAVTSSTKANVVVDIEVYGPADQRVFQQWFSNQEFSPKTTRSYAVTWVVASAAPAGTYRVVVAVKSNDWQTVYTWNAQAASVNVVTPSATPTSAATATPVSSPTPTRAPATATPRSTATATASATPTTVPTATPSAAPTATPTASATATAAPSATGTSTATPREGTATAVVTPTATATVMAGETSGFVRRSGTRFTLDGMPFSFVGANLYNAAGQPDIYECGPWMQRPDEELENWFARARAEYGARVVRFWAYQSYTSGGTDWRALDRVFRLARAHGLKVIPVLENQWAACTEGGYKYDAWYAGGYQQPYGAYPLSYKEYVRRVVTRYAGEPAIAAWMLMNEAESKSAAGLANPGALYAFASDMSAYIKSLDSNHLVTLGVIGSGQPGTSGSSYEHLHSIAAIDFAEYHDYGANDESLPGAPLVVSSGLNTSIYTQDQVWGWTEQGRRANGARAWEAWTATVPAGAQPFQRIGLNLTGAFTGDVYIDSVQIGGRVYDFEDGTTQGWQVSGPGVLGTSAAVPYAGSRTLRVTRTASTGGTLVWIPALAGDGPGTPITVRVYVDGEGTFAYDTLAAALRVAQRLDKPLLVGESGMATCGILAGEQVETQQSRASKLDAKMGAFFASGGAGYLVWQWHPTSSCEFSFTSGDPLNAVLLAHAAQRG